MSILTQSQSEKYPEPCLDATCQSIGYQYADINVPVELKPDVLLGKVEMECCGEPDIICHNSECGSCEVIVSQKVCIKIPIKYGVAAKKGETCIDCNDDCDCGCK